VSTKSITLALLTSLSLMTAGCGVYEQGPGSSAVRIVLLEGASGAKPDQFGGTLLSDVTTLVIRPDTQGGNYFTIYNDIGRVTMALALKDPGAPGVTNVPSALNAVTFTHYRVDYKRTDGRNVQGVDLPYAFESGLTFSVPPDGTVQVGFDIVKHTAKQEAPLRALVSSSEIINTIADVTFYGKDMGGKSVVVKGAMGISFGNFGDPTN
jgi:hypothetical protein